MSQNEKKDKYFYNAGADDYNPLVFVVFFIFAVIAVGYMSVDIYQSIKQ